MVAGAVIGVVVVLAVVAALCYYLGRHTLRSRAGAATKADLVASSSPAPVPPAQPRSAPTTEEQGQLAAPMVPAGSAELGKVIATAVKRAGFADATRSSNQTSAWVLPNTLAQEDLKGRVECALDNMAASEPAEPFLRRWDLLPGRAAGGQAVVAFVRDRRESLMECAIKCAPSCSALRLGPWEVEPSAQQQAHFPIAKHVSPLPSAFPHCQARFPIAKRVSPVRCAHGRACSCVTSLSKTCSREAFTAAALDL